MWKPWRGKSWTGGRPWDEAQADVWAGGSRGDGLDLLGHQVADPACQRSAPSVMMSVKCVDSSSSTVWRWARAATASSIRRGCRARVGARKHEAPIGGGLQLADDHGRLEAEDARRGSF